jgi:hypothetical protein
VSGQTSDVLAKVDASTAALYAKFVAPRLLREEHVVFVAQPNLTNKELFTAFLLCISFSGMAFFYYFVYFQYDTALDACGEGFNPTCRRHYAGAPVMLGLTSLIAAFFLFALVVIISGSFKRLYVVTTKNLILVTVSLTTRYESFKLADLRVRREHNMLYVSDGSRDQALILDASSLDSVEQYLQVVGTRINR